MLSEAKYPAQRGYPSRLAFRSGWDPSPAVQDDTAVVLYAVLTDALI